MNVLISLSRKRNNKTNRFKYIIPFFLTILFLLVLSSCGSSKPRVVTTKKQASKTASTKSAKRSTRSTKSTKTNKKPEVKKVEVAEKEYAASNDFIDEVVENAMKYRGVKYKYGGTTKKGMDCSGLICTAYKEAGGSLPRTSRAMHATAIKLDLNAARKGDFLFFATGKNKKQVNHVALITKVTPGEIQFIHATSSRGVMTSTLNEPYWLNAFLCAGRIE